MRHITTTARILFFSLMIFAGCSTPMKQDIDLTKLKPNERAYTGSIEVDLNGLKNKQLNCDVFLNSDLNAMFRLSPDGIYQFKSIKKNLGFSKIACIYNVNNQKRWIYHSLDLARIQQPADASKIHDLGQIKIVWRVDDTQFNDKDNAFGSEDKMKDIGTLEVHPANTAASPSPQI